MSHSIYRARSQRNYGIPPMLRVDGKFLPTQGFPRIDRYIEHNIELPVADLTISPAHETELRTQQHDHALAVLQGGQQLG